MTADAGLGRDMTFLSIFLVVALADSLVWKMFTRRHPAEAQRPGDVGQLAGNCAAGCLLAVLGLGAMCGIAGLWLAGW